MGERKSPGFSAGGTQYLMSLWGWDHEKFLFGKFQGNQNAIEDREANSFSCGNFMAKCECSCTKIWARSPLEIIQQSYRAA